MELTVLTIDEHAELEANCRLSKRRTVVCRRLEATKPMGSGGLADPGTAGLECKEQSNCRTMELKRIEVLWKRKAGSRVADFRRLE